MIVTNFQVENNLSWILLQEKLLGNNLGSPRKFFDKASLALTFGEGTCLCYAKIPTDSEQLKEGVFTSKTFEVEKFAKLSLEEIEGLLALEQNRELNVLMFFFSKIRGF